MPVRNDRSAFAWLVVLALAAGCDESTSLRVDLRTDLVPGNEFVRVRTEYSTAPFAAGAPAEQDVAVLADEGVDYVRSGGRIATFGGLHAGPAYVRVSLLDDRDQVLVDRVVTAAIRQRSVMVVVVSRSCRGVECPGEGDPTLTTCLAGRCVSPECSAEHPELCGQQSCAADDECRPDEPCAVGQCLDHECFYVGMDARCASDRWCHAEQGCLPRAGLESDGGIADAGMSCATRETTCAPGVDEDCDGLWGCDDPDCEALSCDDATPCTTGDVCTAGVCAGTAIDCEDDNGCTIDSCDPSTGTCTHAPDDGAECDDASACTEGDVCGGDACAGTPISCDDGNPCTTDTCEPEPGCVHTDNTESCDDGLYCNGRDVCAGGVCTRDMLPCTMFCNETTDGCDMCLVDADCGTAPPPSAWTPASCAYPDTCAESGAPQTRTVYAVRCMAGMCTTVGTPESRPCTRDTDGVVCFSSAGTCAYADACDTSQQRTPISRACTAGVCPTSGGQQAATTSGCAIRSTDGASCGSRTRDRCCGGACRDIWANNSHCGGCGQVCESGTTCRIIHAGATAGDGAECYGCRANTECNAPGGSRNCFWVEAGGWDYCQCLDNSGCAPGQTCFTGTGSNYCRY